MPRLVFLIRIFGGAIAMIVSVVSIVLGVAAAAGVFNIQLIGVLPRMTTLEWSFLQWYTLLISGAIGVLAFIDVDWGDFLFNDLA